MASSASASGSNDNNVSSISSQTPTGIVPNGSSRTSTGSLPIVSSLTPTGSPQNVSSQPTPTGSFPDVSSETLINTSAVNGSLTALSQLATTRPANLALAPGASPIVRRIAGQRPNTFLFTMGDGYFYHRVCISGGIIYLRCANYGFALSSCTARASMPVNGSQIPVNPNDHNHPADLLFEQGLEFRRALQDAARSEPGGLLSAIYARISPRFPVEITSRYPLSSVRSSMRRAQYEQRPALPHSLIELDGILTDPRFRNLLLSQDGSDNLYAGMAGGSVVIASQRMLAVLADSEVIFCDSTFFSVPVDIGACQLFTIVMLRDHHILPVVHALMPNRVTESYEEVMNHLVQRVPGFDPSMIISDFERAQMAAFRSVFPGVRILGCFWHYATAVARNARRLGLHGPMRDNFEVRSIVRMAMSLPLCPSWRMREGMQVLELLSERAGVRDIVQPFLLYINDTWLNGVGVGILSVYRSRHRTSNGNETHHRSLNARIGVTRPSVWRFLEVMRDTEAIAWRDYNSLLQGRAPSRARRTAALKNDSRISSLSRQLVANEISMNVFLRNVSGVTYDILRKSMVSSAELERPQSPERSAPPAVHRQTHFGDSCPVL